MYDKVECPVERPPSLLSYFTFFDNFMTRTLGGPAVMNLPPKGVNASHAQMALQNLKKFNTVLRTADLSNPLAKNTWSQSFGWQYSEIDQDYVDAHSAPYPPDNANHHDVPFTDEDRAQLRELNEYDYMLYNSVKAL